MPINISWTFHGDMSAFQAGVSTTSIGQRGSALVIDSVTPRHAGTYTCTARNQVATASYSTVLVVNGTFLPDFRNLPHPFNLLSKRSMAVNFSF